MAVKTEAFVIIISLGLVDCKSLRILGLVEKTLSKVVASAITMTLLSWNAIDPESLIK